MTRPALTMALVSLCFAAVALHAEPPCLQIDCKSPATCVAWSAKGDLLAVGSSDGTVRILDAATGKDVKSWTSARAINAIAFSADGQMVALGHAAGGPSISIWNTQGGAKQKSGVLSNYYPQQVAFTPKGQSVGGVAPGKFIQVNMNGSASGSSSAAAGGCSAIAGDGSLAAWADAKGKVHLRQFDPNKTTTFAIGPVQCLAIGPAGKLLASGGADRDVHLWDITAKKEIAVLSGLPTPPGQLAFSLDGKVLAALAGDGVTLRVWDLARNNTTRRQITHTRGTVGVIALSPDGKLLATTGLDGKVLLLWNVATRDITHKGPPLKLTEKELADLWTDLSDKSYEKSDAAWHKFAAAGDNAVPFLKEQIWPTAVPPTDMTQIEKWVTELDSTKFVMREKATMELMAAGEMAIVPLENVLKKPPSEEAVQRAKLVLKKLAQPVLTPERLRVLEVIELLEVLRTAKSIAVLEDVSRDARVTQIRAEAVQALKRVTEAK